MNLDWKDKLKLQYKHPFPFQMEMDTKYLKPTCTSKVGKYNS